MKNENQKALKNIVAGGFRIDLLRRTSVRKGVEDFLMKLALSLAFVILMWISANSFMYLPFTPVPLTMQVLTVLLSAIVLGGYWAAFTQIEYIFLGLIGAPVFAGFRNGFMAISGPTGGFIIGFVAAGFAAGLLYSVITKRFNQGMKDHEQLNRLIAFVSSLAGIIIIYSLGYFHFLGYISAASGYPVTSNLLLTAFNLAVAPFIIFDLIKIFMILAILEISRKSWL